MELKAYRTVGSKLELKNKQIELENVDEEKLKWKARTDRLKQETQKVNDAVIMNEVKIQQEIQSLKLENSNLKQDVEQKLYQIQDIENKYNSINNQVNEWKRKYDEINEKYEFESGQHDNTLKKLNDIRAVWDGETNLQQLLQIKQQNIQELQSKINEYEKNNKYLKNENDRITKLLKEQNELQSSLKTRINIQRNIIHEQQQQQQQQHVDGDGDNDNNAENDNFIKMSLNEYKYIEQQLLTLSEMTNKYESAQQTINALKEKLVKWQENKTDLNTTPLISNDNNISHQEQIQGLVEQIHKKDQLLHDLRDEYEQIKTENKMTNIQLCALMFFCIE